MIFNRFRIGALVLAGALLAACGTSGSREGQNVTLPPVVVQKGDPVLGAAGNYVGSERCGVCHSAIYAEWGNTLHNKMIKTVAEVGDAAFVNDANGNGVNDFKDGLDLAGNANFSAYGANAPKLSFSGGKYFITIGVVRYEVQRVAGGNGYWKQRYQTRIGRGYYTLPVQYNEVEKTYTAYNGDDWYAAGAPRFTAAYGSDALVVQMDALNNGIDMKGTAVSYENRCAGCHQTGLAVQVGTTSYGGTSVKEVVTGYVELNIGCEACHGPGAAHAASHNKADILNPADLLADGVAGVKRANELCGSCHSRGTSVTLPGMYLPMQAPALLSGSTVIPFLPGDNLLNDLSATGWYLTLTTTASNFWGSFYFASTDVNGKFPLYTASRSNHQQYMDIGQGPHAADKPYDVPCFGCHSPHSAANRHMISTTVKEGGVTKVTATKEENNTLCLACHATFGDFSGITTADVQTVANGGSSAAVNTAILGHMIRRVNMDVPIDLGAGVGRCTACHMPKTARSAASTSLDEDGKQAGDIRSHTMKVVLPNTSVRDVTSTFFNTSATDNSLATSMPGACTACHRTSTAGSAVAGDYELYGWARSGHADYLDAGIGGYTDRLDRSAGTAAEYNFASNSACVSCHTSAGFVDNLAGTAPTAHFIPPTEKNFLNCPTCHEPAAPAAKQHVRQTDTVVFPSGLSVTTGGNSKICFTCHAGRKSKASVDAAVPSGGFYNFADVDPHLFPAAAVLYGPQAQGGYEYPGKAYFVGASHAIPSCAGCHMAAGPSGNWNLGGHALAMTAGSAFNTTGCIPCHGAVADFNVFGNDRPGTLTSLRTLLAATLATQGVRKAEPFVYPYFDNITTPAQLRAAYNYKFVSSDPGAYAHNWRYAAELLYDSLKDLDNTVDFPGKVYFYR
jgi:hypothetical protein